MDIIRTQNLIKDYSLGKVKVRALSGIDMRIEKGEFVAIMGPSGSGKSTLMHIIGCLDRPSEGGILSGRNACFPNAKICPGHSP